MIERSDDELQPTEKQRPALRVAQLGWRAGKSAVYGGIGLAEALHIGLRPPIELRLQSGHALHETRVATEAIVSGVKHGDDELIELGKFMLDKALTGEVPDTAPDQD